MDIIVNIVVAVPALHALVTVDKAAVVLKVSLGACVSRTHVMTQAFIFLFRKDFGGLYLVKALN